MQARVDLRLTALHAAASCLRWRFDFRLSSRPDAVKWKWNDLQKALRCTSGCAVDVLWYQHKCRSRVIIRVRTWCTFDSRIPFHFFFFSRLFVSSMPLVCLSISARTMRKMTHLTTCVPTVWDMRPSTAVTPSLTHYFQAPSYRDLRTPREFLFRAQL